MDLYKKEALEFIEKHKGKCILLHAEYDINDTWEDGIWVYRTSVKKMYNEIVNTVKNTTCVYGIKLYELPEGVNFKDLD